MSDKNFKVKSGLNIPITSANILTTDANGNISSISTLPITSGGTGQTTANNALNALLPTQTGKSAQVLTTDASNTSWAPLYYQGLQSGGVTKTPRTYLNFVGATVTDDSANNATNVTIGSVAIVNYLDNGDSTARPDAVYDAGGSGATTTSWDYTLDAGASVVSF